MYPLKYLNKIIQLENEKEEFMAKQIGNPKNSPFNKGGQFEAEVMPKIAEAQVQKTINELKDWNLFAKLSQQLQDDIIDEVSISTLTTEELSNFS